MRIHITLTDDEGAVFEGDVNLAPVGAARTARKHAKAAPNPKTLLEMPLKLDFTKPERAFVKTHAKGLSGQGKFVLVLAYVAKGTVGKEIQLADVVGRWNKMTSLLGIFNLSYTNRAKENGWVDTKKKGLYVLTSTWKEALEH